MSTITLQLLIIGIVWAKCRAQTSPPMAVIEPTRQILAPGQSVVFSCRVTGTTSSATWMHDNTPIMADANYVINALTNELTVVNFSGNLAGNYTCVATNAVGLVSSNTAILRLAVQEVNFFSTNRQSPHEVTVLEGRPTTISCGTFTSIPPTNLNWQVLFGNAFTSIDLNHDRATEGLNNSLYLLVPTVMDDNTLFSCRLSNVELNTVSTGYVRIRIEATGSPAPDPFVIVPPQDVTTWIGETVSFECIPGGGSSMRAQWVYPVGITNVRVSSDSTRLSISSVDAANVGTYTCTIGGITGTFSASLSLIDPPVLSTGLSASPMSLTYGDPLSLSCSSSTPQTTYWEWFHNGSRLLAETGTSLSVTSTTLDNSGTYQCIGYNLAGYSQSATLITVNTIAADITVGLPANQVIYRDQPFTMSCSARGAPPPTYTWLKADTPLQTGTSFIVGDDGSLLIRQVGAGSEGTYMCQATNVLPNGGVVGVDSVTTLLTPIAPTIIQSQMETLFSVQVATQTRLTCEAIFDPTAAITYSWTKDGQSLALNGHVHFLNAGQDGTIVIEMVEYGDAGVYQCTVETVYNGLAAPEVRSMDTTVTVTDTPVAPHILLLNSSSPTSLYIQWIFSGTPTFVSSYTIEVQASPIQPNSSWVPLQIRSANAVTEATVKGGILQAYMLYNVRVVATYLDGGAAPSESLLVRTGTDVPEDSPREVVGKAPNNMALSISWKPPANPRGEVIDYIIQYQMQGETNYIGVNVGGNDTAYVITNLPEFKKFRIQVAAVTSAGQGPFSVSVEAVTVEGGILNEPPSGSFVTSIGFIMLMVGVGLLIIVTVVVLVLVLRYKATKKRAKGRYHVRHSGYFGGKGTTVIGMDTTDDAALSESAIASYSARHNRVFGSASPSVSGTGPPLDAVLEGEISSFGGTEYTGTTGTPQLSTGSRARLLGLNAPSYIDPPSFEETVMKTQSRSQSASSAHGNRDFDKPTTNWDHNELESKIDFPPSEVFGNPDYTYDDSDNSIEKNQMETASDETDHDGLSDHTQYSHLADINQVTSVNRAGVFHHQLNLPMSASSSGGVPMSFREMVDNRLLHAQSPDESESPLNYATYV